MFVDNLLNFSPSTIPIIPIPPFSPYIPAGRLYRLVGRMQRRPARMKFVWRIVSVVLKCSH